MRGLVAALCACLAAAPVHALDCADPVTQTDMNQCSYLAYQAADGDLNTAYRMARDFARSLSPTGGDALRDAQRAWIAYRDLACAVEGMAFEGGSMQPLAVNACLERLTRQRTEDLRLFAEAN